MWQRLLSMAEAEVESTLKSLPSELQQRARAVPIICERVPSPAMIADGIEHDTLGLFIGQEFADESQGGLPAQILLFLQNIDEMVEADETAFRKEVRVTLIHELGHYLGLDEDDLDSRGLL